MVRVRKKSFIILTILGPLLLAGFILAPILIAQIKDTDDKEVLVVDQTGLFAERLKSGDHLRFNKTEPLPLDSLKNRLIHGESFALLYIEGAAGEEPEKLTLYSKKQLSLDIQSNVRGQLEDIVERERLVSYNIENIDEILESLKANLSVATVRLEKDGSEKQSQTGVLMGIAYIASFAIYGFIFMFGSMVMRGVIEEKANRVVEVIVSSVKNTIKATPRFKKD